MSDPLVQELREESERADIRISVAKLLYRAAQALDAAHQREAVLRAALQQVGPTIRDVRNFPSMLYHRQPVYDLLAVIDRVLAADRDPAVPGLSEK